MTRVNVHARRALVNIAHPRQIRKIEVRFDALRSQIERDGHDIQISGALAVAKQRAFNSISARQNRQFRRSNAGSAIIVRVQRNDAGIAVFEVAAKPFDLVGVNVGRRAFNRRRQIENDFFIRRRLPNFADRFANFQRKIEFGQNERFRRIFQRPLRLRIFARQLLDQFRRFNSDVFDLRGRHTEHNFALRRIGRVVNVNDGRFRAFERLKTAPNQFLAALHQNLNRNVVGNAIFFDQTPAKIEFDLTRRRKADFDLLETDGAQQIEHFQFLGDAHRNGECLIAVAQIHAAPNRRAFDGFVGPGAVFKPTGANGRYFA